MKLNDEFLIHKTDMGELLIPIGEESKKFHGIIKLNETGSIIAHLLEDNDLCIEDIYNHFFKEYPDDDKDIIKQGIDSFIKQLKDVNAITE